jgi:hypothetical protein
LEERKLTEKLSIACSSHKHAEKAKFLGKLNFGREARKQVINTDIAVSNQLLSTKRKAMLILFQKVSSKLAKAQPLSEQTPIETEKPRRSTLLDRIAEKADTIESKRTSAAANSDYSTFRSRFGQKSVPKTHRPANSATLEQTAEVLHAQYCNKDTCIKFPLKASI